MDIIQKPVRNFDRGRFGQRPEAIVMHISEGTMNGTFSWFNNPASRASSHYMISKSGEIWQFVDDTNTAWGNGVVNNPSWGLFKSGINPNFYTISIEHEGKTGEEWTDQMYAADAFLINQICDRFGIPKDRDHIIGHNQIDGVNRRRCPGSGLDFDKLLQLINNYEDPVLLDILRKEIFKLQAELTSVKNEVNGLKASNAQLKSSYDSLRVSYDNLKKTDDELKINFNNLKQTNDQLKISYDKLKIDRDNFKIEYDKVIAQRNNLNTVIADEKKKNGELSKRLVKQTSEIEGLLDEIERISIKLKEDLRNKPISDLITAILQKFRPK